MMGDYDSRSYLSATEVALYLGTTVKQVHSLVVSKNLTCFKSASGQYRFDIGDIQKLRKDNNFAKRKLTSNIHFAIKDTLHIVHRGDARKMDNIEDESVHLVITSPPYFNAKMYSSDHDNDLGNVHELNKWFIEIQKVWREVYRVLQPGRKFFLNIMNLPVRENGSFRSLNLIGKSIDICEEIGFIFKRDIIWQKTNGTRAHFGTYPYPGGILINNMHEFILEFNKPEKSGFSKYAHLTKEIKEQSKLTKDFWLSIKNSDVWIMKPEKSGNNRTHVAPFPVELPKRLIKAYSYIGEIVLDPFSGSGTTMIAAVQENRNSIGYELNQTFINQSEKRLKDLATLL